MKLPEYNYKRVAAVWMDHYQVNVNLANEEMANKQKANKRTVR